MKQEERKIKQKLYYEKNKEKILLKKKEYIVKNKEKILLKKKEYREKNKDKINEYYKKNKDKIIKQHKKRYETNREAIKQYRREYVKKRRQNDIIFKLSENIKVNIRKHLKSKKFKKTSRTEQILGCTYDELKVHLESKFESWMNWDNKGNPEDGVLEPNKTWDIDHIIPLDTAKNEIELLELNHYTNLQPLCSYYNRYIKRNNA